MLMLPWAEHHRHLEDPSDYCGVLQHNGCNSCSAEKKKTWQDVQLMEGYIYKKNTVLKPKSQKCVCCLLVGYWLSVQQDLKGIRGDVQMCDDMKGKYFFLRQRFLISYPDIIQYVIHTLLLFIIFLYWEMVKKNCYGCNDEAQKRKPSMKKSPQTVVCPVGTQGSVNCVGADAWQERDFYCAWSAGKAMPHAYWMCSNLWQQSYSTPMYSTVKYVQRALVFY